MEEAAASDSIAKDMAMTDSMHRFDKDMTGAAPPVRRQDRVPQGPVMPALGNLPGVIQALPDVASTAQEDAQGELDRVLSVMEESEEGPRNCQLPQWGQLLFWLWETKWMPRKRDD